MAVVAVGALGGTIAMTAAAPGEAVRPGLDVLDLVAAVPALGRAAEVRTATVHNLPSASITPVHLLDALRWARDQVDDGADGVVLTHGTDTVEESAYLLDLLWDRPQPLVLTGAMRPPQTPGADGPANLLAAALTALAPACRELGALVVMDDEIHAAATVTKVRSTGVGAFASPGPGPLGRVLEGAVRLDRHPAGPRPAPLPVPSGTARVVLAEPGLGLDTGLLDLLVGAGVDGVVLAGSGAGHVPVDVADAVSRAGRAMPVVVASRTGAGSTTTATYGYPGGEVDLLERGAIMAGPLSPRKARVLLWLLLAGGADLGTVRAEFRRRGGAARD